MTAQFHEGQEVEVQVWKDQTAIEDASGAVLEWRKAKILTVSRPNEPPQTVSVIFTDGTSGVFDVAHVRVPQR